MNSLFFLIIFTCSVFKASSALDSSKSRSFLVITRQSHKLIGYVLRFVVVPSQISCAQTCMLHSSCVSTNYRFSSSLCELNRHGVGEIGIQEGLLEYHTEFVYNEYRQKDCQLIGCRNGGTCIYSQDSRRFCCLCELRWTGDDCDVKRDLVFNFTTLGSKGRRGPTNADAYKGTLLETVKIANGIQEWIVPMTGRYQVEVCGAAGGDGNPGKIGGKGARTKGATQLLKGTVLKVLVGQQGQSGGIYYAGSGGGGTYIVYTNDTPLAIVGGGGGGNTLHGDPGQSDRNGSVNGGSNGSGGGVCQGATPPDGGSGGGLHGNGCCFVSAPCTCSFHSKAGLSYLKGGLGGDNNDYASCDGGFGGGGAYQSTPGGGGGYSGGGTTNTNGGGGGSFKLSEDWVITPGVCEGDGYAVFRY